MSHFLCMLLPHDWRTRKELPVNMLILPRIANLQSAEAFFVVKCEKSCYRLVVFQTTVGESHPVKVNGLDNIVKAFPEEVRKVAGFCNPKLWYPRQGAGTDTIKGSKFVGTLPDNVENFQQYVYRHII
jgi:hypothetical protein